MFAVYPADWLLEVLADKTFGVRIFRENTVKKQEMVTCSKVLSQMRDYTNKEQVNFSFIRKISHLGASGWLS